MKLDEVSPVLDVHPPHETPHGVRDFAIHLFTITIGLLIALSLEGAVEWQHHRHLAHDAAASMRAEIASNAKGMPNTLTDLKKRQDQLSHDVDVLKEFLKTKKFPKQGALEISFGIRTFDNVAWRTAQTTGALSYMPYDEAEDFSSIYTMQDLLADSEKSAARDAMVALAPFLGMKDSDPDPTPEETRTIIDRINILQGQLLLVNSFMTGLDAEYTKFLTAHPQ